MTTYYNKTDGHSPNTRRADWTQFTEDTESAFAQTTIPTPIDDGRQEQHTKGQDA